MNRTILILLLALVAAPRSRGQDAATDQRVHRAINDWKARLDQSRSVRYHLSGTAESKEEIPPNLKDRVKIPPGSRTRPLKATVLIDMKAQRFRLAVEGETPSRARDGYVRSTSVSVYDGKSFQTHVPRESNERDPEDPDVGIATGDLRKSRIESHYWPVFYAHGIVPTVNEPMRVDKLPISHSPEEFEFRGETLLSGRKCILVRTEPANTTPTMTDEFVLEPTRGSAVIRHTTFTGKLPWARIDVEYQSLDGSWLPSRWTHTWTSNGKVQIIYRIVVDRVEINPPLDDRDFTIPLEPGMIVRADKYPEAGSGLDPSKPANETYRVGPDGKPIAISENGFTTNEGVEVKPVANAPWWILALSGAVVILVFSGFLIRRRHRIVASTTNSGSRSLSGGAL